MRQQRRTKQDLNRQTKQVRIWLAMPAATNKLNAKAPDSTIVQTVLNCIKLQSTIGIAVARHSLIPVKFLTSSTWPLCCQSPALSACKLNQRLCIMVCRGSLLSSWTVASKGSSVRKQSSNCSHQRGTVRVRYISNSFSSKRSHTHTIAGPTTALLPPQ